MSLRLPRRLHPGDTVGIISPSSPTTPEAVACMGAYFEARGYRVRVAPHALAEWGPMAGTAEERAADLNGMFADPTVRLILTSMGGVGAVHLVPLIDYAAAARDPKMLLGLSNPAILLNAIAATAGMPTFHGPNGVNFGYNGISRFSEESFWPLVAQALDLPYIFPVSDQMEVVRAGDAVEGPLYGGQIRSFQPLLGSPWAPDWRGSILFVEEYRTELHRFDCLLAHLRLAGVFEGIRGLIVGQLVECEQKECPQVELLEDILLRNCAGYRFPIVANVLLGHTEDKITLPIGCRVRLDTAAPSLELLEPATC